MQLPRPGFGVTGSREPQVLSSCLVYTGTWNTGVARTSLGIRLGVHNWHRSLRLGLCHMWRARAWRLSVLFLGITIKMLSPLAVSHFSAYVSVFRILHLFIQKLFVSSTSSSESLITRTHHSQHSTVLVPGEYKCMIWFSMYDHAMFCLDQYQSTTSIAHI